MKAILIKEGLKYEIDFEKDSKDQLKQMRELVGCDTLDVSYISEEYIAWVDDEGLLKPNPEVNTLVYVKDNEVAYANQLAGNILITGYNDSGETLGLTEEQIIDVKHNIRLVI